eukprot:3000110-Rhodomonas_salina.2
MSLSNPGLCEEKEGQKEANERQMKTCAKREKEMERKDKPKHAQRGRKRWNGKGAHLPAEGQWGCA